jgi:hypothetical protein
MADTMNRLEAAGFPVSRIPNEQRDVLSQLSEDEVRVLTSIKERLDSAGPDVEGHLARASDDGYVFW